MNFKSKITSFINIKIDYKVDYDDIKCKIDARKYVKVKEKNNLFTKIKENKRYRVTAISVLASLLCAGIVIPFVIDKTTVPPKPSKLPDIYNIYSIGIQQSPNSFANLKLLEIDESYYVKEGTDRKYIYVKFEVIEDFYQELLEKEQVSILFDVNLGLTPSSKKYFEKAELDNWLLSQDSFCINFKAFDGFRNNYINETTGKYLHTDTLVTTCDLSHLDTIAINNGKVDLDTIDQLSGNELGGYHLVKSFIDYTKYIQQGMEAETLFENLRQLYIDSKKKEGWEEL